MMKCLFMILCCMGTMNMDVILIGFPNKISIIKYQIKPLLCRKATLCRFSDEATLLIDLHSTSVFSSSM